MERDEEVCLSEQTLKALQEFYMDKEKGIPAIGAIEENWVKILLCLFILCKILIHSPNIYFC